MSEQEVGNRREWVISVLEAYECRLTRYATRLLSDEEAARDVVQHAFLKLCDRAPSDVQDRVGPWLFSVCRNRAVDLLRQRSAKPVARVEEDAAPVSPEPNPADLAERLDSYACLATAMADLPEAQREALDLWTEGFSHREIAEITGHQSGHVRVLIHRALASLRRHPAARQLLLDEPADRASPRGVAT